MNFWQKLNNPFDKAQGKPILCLAPMADVTDAAFRYLIAKYSDTSHVTYTEFVSADGLVKAPEEGRKKLLKNLEFDEIERPIVAQFFTSKPEMMEKAAELAVELGMDGVDINMGCPDKSVEKQGAGAALMKKPELAKEIILAAKAGVKNDIPVSVKTRIGYNKNELETWLPKILEAEPAAVIIHARTRKEMSKVPANWEHVKEAVRIRNNAAESGSLRSQDASHISLQDHSLPPKILIIGNGDVLNIEDAYGKCEASGADGVMLGRAVFGNPWLFSSHVPTAEERVKVLMEHIEIFDAKLGSFKNFAVMKKHFKSYLSGIPNIKEMKDNLMRSKNAKEAIEILSHASQIGAPVE